MDEKEFWAQFWFSPLDNVTVINPTSEDYTFQTTINVGVDVITGRLQDATREFTIAKGEHKTWPGPIANKYLSEMFTKLVQEDGRVESLADFAARKEYYEKLIASKESSIDQYQAFDTPDDGTDVAKTEAQEKPFETLGDSDARSNPTSEVSEKPASEAKSRATAVAKAKK